MNLEASDKGEFCDEVKDPSYYNLAKTITDQKLSDIEKYRYLTKHYSPLDQDSMFDTF